MNKKAFSLTELLIVITILFILTTVFICSYGNENWKTKHTIKGNGKTYYTDYYRESGDCISFIDRNKNNVKICGNYTLMNNK